MQITRYEAMPDIAIIISKPFHDHRGTFLESYRESELLGITGFLEFVQGNVSISKANVVRGLHYQVARPQGKLMRTVHGKTFNVAVDMRAGSPTFGKAATFQLIDPNTAIWVPPGFANGFVAREDGTVVVYETSTYHEAGFDRALRWNDPALGIDWPGSEHILSDKDAGAPLLEDAERVPLREWLPEDIRDVNVNFPGGTVLSVKEYGSTKYSAELSSE